MHDQPLNHDDLSQSAAEQHRASGAISTSASSAPSKPCPSPTSPPTSPPASPASSPPASGLASPPPTTATTRCLLGMLVTLAALICPGLAHSRPRHLRTSGVAPLRPVHRTHRLVQRPAPQPALAPCQLNIRLIRPIISLLQRKPYRVARIGGTSDTLGNRRILQAKRVPVPMKRQRVAVAGVSFAGLVVVAMTSIGHIAAAATTSPDHQPHIGPDRHHGVRAASRHGLPRQHRHRRHPAAQALLPQLRRLRLRQHRHVRPVRRHHRLQREPPPHRRRPGPPRHRRRRQHPRRPSQQRPHHRPAPPHRRRRTPSPAASGSPPTAATAKRSTAT